MLEWILNFLSDIDPLIILALFIGGFLLCFALLFWWGGGYGRK